MPGQRALEEENEIALNSFKGQKLNITLFI